MNQHEDFLPSLSKKIFITFLSNLYLASLEAASPIGPIMDKSTQLRDVLRIDVT